MEVNGQAIAELVPIALLIIIANGLVLVLFFKRKQLRTPPNFILFSLAICDLTSGVIHIPLFIIVAFTPVVQSIELHYYLRTVVSVFHNASAISTCYHILVATAEKYMSIALPVKHRQLNTKTIKAVLGVVWTWSIVFSFIPFAWVNMEDSDSKAKFQIAHVVFCLVTVFLLPYIFMIYAFVSIFKKISSFGKEGQKMVPKRHSLQQTTVAKRCLVLFASMATIYLVCWLPWYILMLLYQICPENEQLLMIPSKVILLLRYAASISNPCLYAFLRRDFKLALKSLFRNC